MPASASLARQETTVGPMSHLQKVFILATLLFAALLCVAQDPHLDIAPSKALMHRSAWAHGYMHGYEAGFHTGNLDLHMQRPIRNPHSVKEYHQPGKAYHGVFGNKEEFSRGYGSGFEVGYLDGASGKDFRAATLAADLSGGIQSDSPSDGANRFDDMIQTGYAAGRHGGLADARASVEFDSGKVRCPDNAGPGAFCAAYLIGYRWGYSDGFTNQRTESDIQTAKR